MLPTDFMRCATICRDTERVPLGASVTGALVTLALRSVLSNADVRWNPFEAIVEHPTLVGSLLVARAPGSASCGCAFAQDVGLLVGRRKIFV